MKYKLPDFVVREVFCRVVNTPGRVSSGYRFIWKGNCPVCGDTRQRMYVKDYGDDFMVFCHNCGYSKPFGFFIKDYFPHELEYLKQYFLESIKNGTAFKKEEQKSSLRNRLNYKYDELDIKLRLYANKHGFSIKDKQENPKLEKYRKKCIKTFTKRNLSKDFIKDLWCFTTGPLGGYCGIPFFSEDKNIIHWQGRRMWEPVKGSFEDKNNPKYKFLKDVEEGIEIESKPFYGEHYVKPQRYVKIAEGVPDALSFQNGLATCGATLSVDIIQELKRKYPKRIWVPDNIWIDNAGRALIDRLLRMKESCFVFPFGTTQKDANKYIVDNKLQHVPEELIQQNTYTGISGLVKLQCIARKEGIKWKEKKENGTYQKSSKGKSSDHWL